MTLSFSYLQNQFREEEAEAIWAKIKPIVLRGDFTLGRELRDFEEAYTKKCGTAHAIGVNSGTDAIALPLMALNITGEVIVPAFSFVASVGAIVQAGAKPVLVDVRDDFNIDPSAIEAAITPRTDAIVCVHWAGRPCNMDKIADIARRRGLYVIEDAAQGLGSLWNGRSVGSYGTAGAFSLHPLKRVNVWGDGGIITTSENFLAERLHRLRNHGLLDRNVVMQWGVNSRLDTIQAVVAHHVLGNVDRSIGACLMFAASLYNMLAGVPGIHIVPMHPDAFSNYYLYTFLAKNRNELLAALNKRGIEAKAHYPIPLHLQPAAESLGYKRGAFPMAERCADETISLPCHEYLSMDDMDMQAAVVREFYETVGVEAVA